METKFPGYGIEWPLYMRSQVVVNVGWERELSYFESSHLNFYLYLTNCAPSMIPTVPDGGEQTIKDFTRQDFARGKSDETVLADRLANPLATAIDDGRAHNKMSSK
jgi:hypothetical protein